MHTSIHKIFNTNTQYTRKKHTLSTYPPLQSYRYILLYRGKTILFCTVKFGLRVLKLMQSNTQGLHTPVHCIGVQQEKV